MFGKLRRVTNKKSHRLVLASNEAQKEPPVEIVMTLADTFFFSRTALSDEINLVNSIK